MNRTGGRYYEDPRTGEVRRADEPQASPPAPMQPAKEPPAPAAEADPSPEPATDAATPAKKG